MARRRKSWMRIAFGVGVALVLTSVATRSSAHRPRTSMSPSDEKAPAAAEPSPRFVRFIHRHALAEIAALFGIPLAVIGLLFTALATRDAAQQQQASNKQLAASIQQLRIAEQAAQPELLLNGHVVAGGSANSPDRFDRLSLEIRGVAKQIKTEVDTAIVVNDLSVAKQYITYIDWWRWSGAGTGEAARWTASPHLLSHLDSRPLKKGMWVDSIISASYADVFGRFHIKYFRVIENLGAQSPYSTESPSYIGEVDDPSAAVRCLQAATAQRDLELDRSRNEGRVRQPTRLYAKLAQGKPITAADVEASAKLETPDECEGV
jgi:hypothetical protein